MAREDLIAFSAGSQGALCKLRGPLCNLVFFLGLCVSCTEFLFYESDPFLKKKNNIVRLISSIASKKHA